MSYLLLHRWLGLVSGLIVFVIAVTGALYAFQGEILDRTEQFRHVRVRNEPLLPPSQLLAAARRELPDKLIHSLEYQEPGLAAVAMFYQGGEDGYYFKTYLDPYTGEVLRTQDQETGFFHWVLDGHMYLWLPKKIGRVVVLVATVIFVVMLLTGFVLWLPKKAKQLRQRLTFRWTSTTRWKRKNWDLHAVGGIYSLVFALVFAVTGLVYVLPGWAGLYHAIVGGEKSVDYVEPASVVPDAALPVGDRMDGLFTNYRSLPAAGTSVEFHPPATDSSVIVVVTNDRPGTYWKSDYVYHDQYTLEERPVAHLYGRYADADVADKVLRLNYDIHVGAALGLPGKILAFLASLVIAGLVVTGGLLWWGRRNGKGRQRRAVRPRKQGKVRRAGTQVQAK